MPIETAADYSIDWWKKHHEKGYFPNTEQHFQWRVYEHIPPWWSQIGVPLLSDDLVLEVGCGYGEWMIPISKFVATIKGFDIHQMLVDKAREKFAEHGVTNAEMVLGDGRTIPFPDQAFSLVYSISVFQHIPRQLVAGYLREVARVLRPTGRFVGQFRLVDGSGQYSDDIGINHTGDWSVGWTAEQAEQAAVDAGLFSSRIVELQNKLILIAHPPR